MSTIQLFLELITLPAACFLTPRRLKHLCERVSLSLVTGTWPGPRWGRSRRSQAAGLPVWALWLCVWMLAHCGRPSSPLSSTRSR